MTLCQTVLTLVLILIKPSSASEAESQDAANLKNALHKAKAIFNTYIEEVRLIQHNIHHYDKLCPDVQLFSEEVTKECGKFEKEMTEYLKKISGIPYPPINHTVQYYWSQEKIWRDVDTEFVCFESEHFKKLIECLCEYCKWPFVVEDERYNVSSEWEKEYQRRDCQKRTSKSFMNVGDDMCQWMS